MKYQVSAMEPKGKTLLLVGGILAIVFGFLLLVPSIESILAVCDPNTPPGRSPELLRMEVTPEIVKASPYALMVLAGICALIGLRSKVLAWISIVWGALASIFPLWVLFIFLYELPREITSSKFVHWSNNGADRYFDWADFFGDIISMFLLIAIGVVPCILIIIGAIKRIRSKQPT